MRDKTRPMGRKPSDRRDDSLQKQRHLRREIDRLRTKDAQLPQLLNKPTVESAIAASLQPLAIIYTDINSFKKVNDKLGHAVGDEILQLYATHITQRFRRAGDSFYAGRVGGDEFVLVATIITGKNRRNPTCQLKGMVTILREIEAELRQWLVASHPKAAKLGGGR